MSFWVQQSREIRPAKGEVLLDGRKRLTRYVSWKLNNETQPEIQYTYGDADAFTGTTPTGWTGLLLAKIEADNSPANNGAGNDPVIQLFYETPGTVIQTDETKNNGGLLLRTIVSFWTTPATPSGYTLVSTNTENVNGFAYKTYTFAKGNGEISRDTDHSQCGTTVDGTVGVTRLSIRYLTAPAASEPTWSGVSGYVQIAVTHAEQDGYMLWTAVYAKGAGTVSQTDDTKNNGALLLRTLVALGSAPSTPSGYTAIDTQVRQDEGYIVYTYQFAKGTGEIGRSIDYSQSSDQGTTGVTRTTIRYLVVPSATVQPTSLSGSVEIGRNVEELDGHRVWVTTWAKGTGLVSQLISSRQDGLREVTNIALGTRSAPSGVVLRDDYRLDSGFSVFTVTSMQAADGNSDPTTGTMSFERYVPFTYPGRAKAWVENVSPKYFLDVFLGPPVQTQVKATVAISYTTTATLGTISDYWNPTSWATIRATWVGAYGVSASRNQPLPGYRTVSSTPVTLTGTGYNECVFGYSIYAGEDATVTVSGGPSDPGGSTWTLSAELEPAFISSTGTKYLRKTIVTAAIPSQSALPV